jgi:acyl-CoA reductase-like NAD-dependent aldehyde dehydrogenase
MKVKPTTEVPRTEPLGVIPAYLVGRKKELEEAQEQARLARAPPSAPPGQRLVPEEERLATLDKLRLRMRELEGDLARLPLTMRSILSQQKRAAIEHGMEEVENAIRTFSKQKVFVVL